MNDDKLTTKAAAALANTSDAYIRQLILAGKLRADKFGKVWVVSGASLKQWMAEREKR